MWDVKPFWNYTSVDPKQFTVSKFRLKPVILISECFCSRCGHTNQHPPPTWRETKGDKTTSEPKKAATPTNTHPPHEGRQPETTGDKTTSEPKKPTTPTNTKAARSKVALRTPTVNCLGKKKQPLDPPRHCMETHRIIFQVAFLQIFQKTLDLVKVRCAKLSSKNKKSNQHQVIQPDLCWIPDLEVTLNLNRSPNDPKKVTKNCQAWMEWWCLF